MVTLRIPHAKNYDPLGSKTVAYRPRTHGQTHRDKEKTNTIDPLFRCFETFDFFKGVVKLRCLNLVRLAEQIPVTSTAAVI